MRNSAPLLLIASIFVRGAPAGTTTRQGILKVDAAWAIAWPWFPADTVSTVRLSLVSTSSKIRAYAPLNLKEWVCWWFSNFRNRFGTSLGTIGVIRIYGWMRARTWRKSLRVIRGQAFRRVPSIESYF